MIKPLITFTLIWNLIMAQTSNEELNNEIQKGNFTKAAEIISDMLKNNNMTRIYNIN